MEVRLPKANWGVRKQSEGTASCSELAIDQPSLIGTAEKLLKAGPGTWGQAPASVSSAANEPMNVTYEDQYMVRVL